MIKLTENSINYFLGLEAKSNKFFYVNKKLQVIDLISDSNQIKCNLSDGNYFSDKFLISINLAKKNEIKKFDIIVIQNILLSSKTSKDRRLMIIKYLVESNENEIIGNPIRFILNQNEFSENEDEINIDKTDSKQLLNQNNNNFPISLEKTLIYSIFKEKSNFFKEDLENNLINNSESSIPDEEIKTTNIFSIFSKLTTTKLQKESKILNNNNFVDYNFENNSIINDLDNSNIVSPVIGFFLSELTPTIKEFTMSFRVFKYNIEDTRNWKLSIIDKRGDIGLLIIPHDKMKQYFNLIKLYQTYKISNGEIKKSNDDNYKIIITVTNMTILNKILDHIEIGNKDNTEFIKISNLYNPLNNSFKCFVYVCKVYDLESVKTKDSLFLPLRRVLVADESFYKCNFDLLREFSNINIKDGDVMYIQFPVRSTSLSGIKIETGGRTKIEINPPSKRTRDLIKIMENFNLDCEPLSSEATIYNEEFKKINI